MTRSPKNRPHDNGKNHPQDDSKIHPDITNPVVLCGVIGEQCLGTLLVSEGFPAWSSRVRVHGLLLLIDYICRNAKKGQISISADLAHGYASKLKNQNGKRTVTEPLQLLCVVGILEKIRSAVYSHIKTPAVYRVADPYRNRQHTIHVFLTPKLASKRLFAKQRLENRLNQKYLFRKQLLADLNAASLDPAARPKVAKALNSKSGNNMIALVKAIDSPEHTVRVSERGQITTSISSCPRDLQSHLRLYNEPTVSCDISHAHWNFLPLILENRLNYVSQAREIGDYVNAGWRERNELVSLLSDGDFYRNWCHDTHNDIERAEKKNVLNILLNSKNEVCAQNLLYQRIRGEFPITFGVIEDIKRTDHRNLAKQLHRFTADAVEAALSELQRVKIPVIPHVDALICRAGDRKRVCEVLGRKVFDTTGVCAVVGSICYTPLTEVEEQALAFDEAEPANESMSYDEWEAMRLVKCVATCKLMRRCPPLFVSYAKSVLAHL